MRSQRLAEPPRLVRSVAILAAGLCALALLAGLPWLSRARLPEPRPAPKPVQQEKERRIRVVRISKPQPVRTETPQPKTAPAPPPKEPPRAAPRPPPAAIWWGASGASSRAAGISSCKRIFRRPFPTAPSRPWPRASVRSRRRRWRGRLPRRDTSSSATRNPRESFAASELLRHRQRASEMREGAVDAGAAGPVRERGLQECDRGVGDVVVGSRGPGVRMRHLRERRELSDRLAHRP